MTKLRQQTPEQQLQHLLVLRAAIEEIPATSITEGLFAWTTSPDTSTPTTKQLLANGRCGATACLGGWVAVMPYFRKLGVQRDIAGAPVAWERPYSDSVAEALFGDQCLFAVAGGHSADPNPTADESDQEWGKRCALERIDSRIRELTR